MVENNNTGIELSKEYKQCLEAREHAIEKLNKRTENIKQNIEYENERNKRLNINIEKLNDSFYSNNNSQENNESENK